MLVANVGVTFLFLTDPSLFVQSVVLPDDRIQVAEWDVGDATLDISGALVDPTSGSFSLDLDLSALGIAAGEDIGSMEIFE